MLRYDWPGNVREMENEVMRACALSKDLIKPEHLNRTIVEGAMAPALDRAANSRIRGLALAGKTLKEVVAAEVDEIENQVIQEVLRRTRYKKSKAASILGISRPTLDAKIEKYGLTREKVITGPLASATSGSSDGED